MYIIKTGEHGFKINQMQVWLYVAWLRLALCHADSSAINVIKSWSVTDGRIHTWIDRHEDWNSESYFEKKKDRFAYKYNFFHYFERFLDKKVAKFPTVCCWWWCCSYAIITLDHFCQKNTKHTVLHCIYIYYFSFFLKSHLLTVVLLLTLADICTYYCPWNGKPWIS